MPKFIDKKYIQDRPTTRIERFISFIASDRSVRLLWLSVLLLVVLPFVFFPIHALISLVIRHHRYKTPVYPFYMPKSSGAKFDPFNINPDKTIGPADGISYWGNEVVNNTQVWQSNNILRQHIGMLATTGSGKTFTLNSIGCVNALMWGAGYFFVDAKADLGLVTSQESIMWRFNRIDDCFILNYIRGSRDKFKFHTDHTTNTYNLLESGSASQSTETMKSLSEGDNDIWAKRADSLQAGLLKPLTYLRDRNMINLSVLTLLDYLTLETSGKLLSNEAIPESETKQLYGFIKTLPGMTNEFFSKILQGQSIGSTQVYDQWGFAAMQIILVINRLAGDYGDIFGVSVGQINLEAIVFQDRVLLGLIPALEGSTDSVAAMGRIIMAARKGVMGRALGEGVQGSVAELIKNRPSNAVYPYQNIMDEVGMIFAKGEGAVAAQARGLGFSVWYAAQDTAALRKLGGEVEKEVDQVLGNTVTKITGRILHNETYELLAKMFGQQFVWQRDRTDIDYSPTTGVQRTKESSGTFQKEDKLDRELTNSLRESELVVTAIDRFHQINGAALIPKEIETQVVNDFLITLPHQEEEIQRIIDDHVFLETEYDLIINGKQELRTVEPPPLNFVKDYVECLDRSKEKVGDQSSAPILGFSVFVRETFERMQEDANAKDSHFERLKATPVSGNSSAPDAEGQADDKASLPTPSHTPSPVDNTIEPVTHSNNELAIEPVSGNVDQSSNPDVQATSGSRVTAGAPISSTRANSNTSSQDEAITNNVKPSTPSDGHVLSSYFDQVGLSKETIVSNLSEIAALTNRTTQLKKQVDEGQMSPSEANDRMQKELDETDRSLSETHAVNTMSEIIAKTIHPTDPTPQTNKRMTLGILERIKYELENKVDGRGDKAS